MTSPAISIGVPVYNGEKTLSAALDALLSQDFRDFEIIISDNASTDGTSSICREYTAQDSRIIYYRQDTNLGAVRNLKFVLSKARGEMFIWAASDDTRSIDFLKENYEFLKNNPEYVASTCPNTFENWEKEKKIEFSLEGNLFQRFCVFFKNCFKSHGLFYSLIRTDVLKKCSVVKPEFLNYDWLGFDWAIILYLASLGKINRTQNGLLTFGVHGESSNLDIFKKYNRLKIEYVFPFYHLSLYVIELSKCLPILQRVWIVLLLLQLNLRSKYEPIFVKSQRLAYKIYKRLIKKK